MKYVFILIFCLALLSCGNKKTQPTDNDARAVELDLTVMSPTMIYSTIFEMLIEPELYENKNVKVSGFFNSFIDETSGNRYYAIIIPDATACCKQGMEFIWLNHSYPEDFPKENQNITISGIYRTTTLDGGISYNYLEISELSF